MSETKPAKRLERYKILWEISEASPIIRRYFAMNFFDGVLTALGIVLSSFVFYIDPTKIGSKNSFIFFTGLTTAVAIGISGLTGSHLAESAERRLNVIQMKQVLGIEPLKKNGKSPNRDLDAPKWSEREILRALGSFEHKQKKAGTNVKQQTTMHLGLTPEQAQKLKLNIDGTPINKNQVPNTLKEYGNKKDGEISNKKGKKKKEKLTIFEEAQEFAGKVAALIDGLSPFLGVMVVVVPFMISTADAEAKWPLYVISFITTVIVLFLLGAYLALLSQDSIKKYGFQMVFAAVLTAIFTVGLGILVQQI